MGTLANEIILNRTSEPASDESSLAQSGSAPTGPLPRVEPVVGVEVC